jgi:AcrR family transcriptional regulator
MTGQHSSVLSGEERELASGQAEDGGCRPMRADARRNYERLVAAAKKVFAEHGAEASMEAIAREAGVGIGTLYRHFPKRIDVVEAVYQADVDALVGAAESAAQLDPWEGLVSYLEAFVRYANGKRTLLSELHEAFEKHPELKVASRERIEQAMGVVLARAQQAGVARQDADGADVMQLVGPMCTSATLGTEQAPRLLTVILDGLRPPRA